MKKVIFTIAMVIGMGSAFAASPDPTLVVELLPYSQYTASTTYTGAFGYTSAVTVSSSVITQIDSAFNTVMESTSTGLGPMYYRAELTVQNNDTTDKFCGYSATALTIANSYKIAVGATWTFKVGKGVKIYCLNAAGAGGTMIVGGVAWK